MELNILEEILLKKKGSYIDYPFGDDVMTFKIENKVFALIAIEDNPLRMNLKAEPNDAIAYREIYESVIPGYHMNKKHWNTLILDESIPLDVIKEMIDESYDLVFKKLTKVQKEKVSLL